MSDKPRYESLTLGRVTHKKPKGARQLATNKRGFLRKEFSGSVDDLYVGKKVTELSDSEFVVKMKRQSLIPAEIDLDLGLESAKEAIQQLTLEDKPELSHKARRRLSSKKKSKPSKGSAQETRERTSSDTVLSSPGHSGGRGRSFTDGEAENGRSSPSPFQSTLPVVLVEPADSKPSDIGKPFDLDSRYSVASRDSGLGEDPCLQETSSTEGAATLESLTTANHLQPLARPGHPFDSIRSGTKRHRKSMLLSELCVVTVTVPAEVAQSQKGRGAVLKFRFSPYTQIEFLRVAILKQFHERCEIPIPQLSKLHLCRYLEDDEGWEWLEEDQALRQYQLPTECKLELKPLEPVYRDVRVVIPQLESSMSVEYDQFSTVGDVLHQVLSLADPPLQATEGYSLYHVRLRMHMDSSDSMVYYQVLPSDVLECRMSAGRLHSVILTIKIPSIQSSRKVKVSLDETVGELISTLMRRVPDPDGARWNHMALYLQPREKEPTGVWMEDFKFLAAYKLRSSDVVEFRPKYRPMLFELRVYPHDHYAESDLVYSTPELLVAQDTLVSEIVELLCNSGSLEYDPRFYGLYLHDASSLPGDASMWDYLDNEVASNYQDSIVMHMVHKPVQVSMLTEEDSTTVLQVDFSQPCRVLRDILCRRYGVRHHTNRGLQYNGASLELPLSLHNQGVVEMEHVLLLQEREDPPPQPPTKQLVSSEEIDPRRLSMAQDDLNIWDEVVDGKQCIRFGAKNQVVGATFNKLVERITSSKEHDIEFVKTFLYTYQSFSTPRKLLKKLIERYNVVRSPGTRLKEFSQIKHAIQARVINALRMWTDLSVDFKDDPNLQDEVLHFVNAVLIHDHPRLCKPLRNSVLAVKGVIQRKNLKLFRDQAPPVKFPPTPSALLTIFHFDPEEIARQLTIIDFSLFEKIKPSELLNQAWQKEKYKHRAVNILRLVERMNNLTLWVATTILSQRDVHQRAKRITDFVQISTNLLKMHNYCTLMSILNGVAHPSISRLKKSFIKLDKSSSKKLEELQTLVRPGDHFKLLRDALKRASNPCIPYLGLYMSDLTFLDNGNPNFHEDGLINFSKCRLIYNQIRDLVLRQDKPYNFEEVPALHESLIKFHFLDTDVLYDVSLQREPRAALVTESNKFCENWAQVLLAQGTSSPDPFFLRHAVENYKLKDINALKRLLRQAKSDYHALFRCYAFLCVCGNGKLLLQCASQEAQSLPSPEALGVLEALHVFSDRCGFSLRTS